MSSPDLTSPRFVCFAAELIKPSRPSVWTKEGREIAPGEKVLVLFSPGDSRYSPSARFYPLTPDRDPGKPPPVMRVGYADHVDPKSHVVFQSEGITVYITVASRQRRVEYQLSRLQNGDNIGNLIDALIDLDHLIFHRCIIGLSDAQDIAVEYERVSKLKALAMSTPYQEERKTALNMALKIAKRIGGLKDREPSLR